MRPTNIICNLGIRILPAVVKCKVIATSTAITFVHITVMSNIT